MTTNATPDTGLYSTGQRVLFRDIARPANGNEDHTAIAETIHAQMGRPGHDFAGIRSAWAIVGRHGGGGMLLILDPDKTSQGGNVFVVSYHRGGDDYTITYAKRDGDHVQIIRESDGIYADQLCELFSGVTGISIPVVSFG